MCNMCQFAVWLRTYHYQHGEMPPIVVYDDDRNPMHSWRILYARFQYPEEFAGYNMDQPWDSFHNAAFIKKIPDVFRCGNDTTASRTAHETSYVAISHGGAFANIGGGQGIDPETAAEEVSPFLVVEMAESGIPWTQPVDLDVETMSFRVNDFENPSIRSHDPDGPTVLDAGFHKERLSANHANEFEGEVEQLAKGTHSRKERSYFGEKGIFQR